VSPLIVDGLIVLAAVFGWRAVRHLVRALREPDRDDSSLHLVWGIRALIIAATSAAFALGIVYGSRATMLIAAVILAEELYETGVVLLALRRHRPRSHPSRWRPRSSGGEREGPRPLRPFRTR
jgi:hypothetical protein